MKRFSQVTFALLLTMAGKAFGQGSYDYPIVQGLIEGGGAITTGGTSQFLDSGFTVGGGVLIHPGHGPLGIRVTLDYTRLDASRDQIDAERADGVDVNHGEADFYNLRVNGVYERPISPYARAYITAGVGLAYERLNPEDAFVLPASGYGPGGIGAAIGAAFGEAFSQVFPAFSYNVAAGLDFSLGGRNSLFIETGYEHINAYHVDTDFVPLRVGMRF